MSRSDERSETPPRGHAYRVSPQSGADLRHRTNAFGIASEEASIVSDKKRFASVDKDRGPDSSSRGAQLVMDVGAGHVSSGGRDYFTHAIVADRGR